MKERKFWYITTTLVQNTDPIYLDSYKKGFLDFRTHFYAPSKYIFGIKTDTFVFNISLVLLSCLFFYILLYFEVLGKTVRFFENLNSEGNNIYRIVNKFYLFLFLTVCY